ncbi:MAG: hypothetical protein AB8G11_12100 [Saprospiraceae bacterium]
MKKEFVIDGTDIICKHTDEQLLTPLLQLLLHFHNEQVSFYCYFDADTRYKFTRDIDKQIYQSIIKFGLNDYFNQSTGGDADRLILKQATDINATIISSNNFENFKEDFEWLNNTDRIAVPQITNNQLIIKNLNININIEPDISFLAVQLINGLELERNNLNGVIDRYKSDRDFGFIRRSIGNKKLFFHKDSVVDSSLEYSQKDTPVSFTIDMDNSGGIHYFCAIDVKENTITEAETVKQLAQEREQLSASKDFLQQQALDLKTSFEKEIQAVLQKNQQLQTENTDLRNQIGLFTDNKDEVLQKIESERKAFDDKLANLEEIITQKDVTINELKREIELLNAQKQAALQALDRKVAESNAQAVTIDFQQEKISGLDEDLKAALRLVQMPQLKQSEALKFEELKEEYNILLNSVAQKNSQITFLNNNLQDLQTQLEGTAVTITKTDEVEQLIEKVKDLEVSNKLLKAQIQDLEMATPKNNTQKEETFAATPQKTTVVTLSDEAKQYREERPKKVVIEATRTELENWWYNLEEQWQVAFNQSVLSRGEDTSLPDEDQLRSLFKRKKIDIVGNGILFFGLNQLSIKLTNLSGLKELSQIEDLNISGHDLMDLRGLEHFDNLEFLNCTSNQITTIEYILHLEKLKSLNLQDNSLFNLRDVEKLSNLTYLNCLYNSTLKSISKVGLLKNLETFKVDNYKTIIRLELKDLEKNRPNLYIGNV